MEFDNNNIQCGEYEYVFCDLDSFVLYGLEMDELIETYFKISEKYDCITDCYLQPSEYYEGSYDFVKKYTIFLKIKNN